MKRGNMLIAQSGGPSMVINQSLVGAVLAAMESPAVGRIYGARHGIKGILDGEFIDLRKDSRATLEAVNESDLLLLVADAAVVFLQVDMMNANKLSMPFSSRWMGSRRMIRSS